MAHTGFRYNYLVVFIHNYINNPYETDGSIDKQ